jgi:membrane-associated protease RseP (regulator of RpoE activity)
LSDRPIEPPFVSPSGAAAFPPASRPRFQHRYGIHVLLLVLTFASTTLVGMNHYYGFLSDFGVRRIQFDWWQALTGGLWDSLSILGILGAHEMGHYLMCRFHNVDATLPYFIPAPIQIAGTLGAVIRIREPFPTRAILFDVGAGGPIAGFLVIVPVLFAGLAMSNVRPLPPDFTGFSLGEPLFFKAATWMVWGKIAEGYSLNMHPMVFAAWFGLLATAWNLLPFGQLDGGHITYAALGRSATGISYVTLAAALALTWVSLSWLFFTGILVVMAVIGALRHPPPLYDFIPLDPPRRTLAICTAVIFILSFTPAPIEIYEAIKPI